MTCVMVIDAQTTDNIAVEECSAVQFVIFPEAVSPSPEMEYRSAARVLTRSRQKCVKSVLHLPKTYQTSISVNDNWG